MIANPKWFNLRKYSGWGLTPNCWQGGVYLLVYIILIIIIGSFSLDENLKNILIFTVIGVLIIDVLHIMSKIPQDERERLHGAIADRNALWFLLFGTIIWAFVKQITDPIFIGIILGTTAVKALTQIYLKDK
jgi:hypothetical protein